ncbi:hypothetical protein LSTR_LSTR005338 [Laodelphax striatellus]|uniref:Ig-like domain-containing protein n=1 Tax=Laodelphax striatellus TaxID=195883 RepID=A0A482X855_LAOST|nr:hypothetical protein LSTR_LSTR005338 [Laodelphax striatellus]
MMDSPCCKFVVCAWFLVLYIHGGRCLRNVTLEAPSYVRLGEPATLVCHYDLEEGSLYSVKWYRGRHEFYRYSPGDRPTNKIFPFPGINVNLEQSNATQVTLTDVGFNLSGNLSCEVTAEEPPFFRNAVVSTSLIVIKIPEKKPVLFTEQTRYKAGDELRANCSSAPSRPHATLSFLLNNHPVGVPMTKVHTVDGEQQQLQWSSLTLRMPLYPSHFTSSGQLVLKCIALVAHAYRATAELQLVAAGKEPVPERVTSPNAANVDYAVPSFPLLLACIAAAIR